MKAFLRENPTIAFGLGLPLLLVVVFLLVSGIPALLVEPPKHDVLYVTGYNNYSNGLQVSVVNKKVQVTFRGNRLGNQQSRIWRYSPATGAVQEVAIVFPPDHVSPEQGVNTPEAAVQVISVEVPDLEGVSVDSSSIAPDGYEFSTGRNRRSGDIFIGLFNSSRYRNEAVLTKNGRSIRLPNSGNTYYSYNTHFIGWVVSQ